MFEIRQPEQGLVQLVGRFDAAQLEVAQPVLEELQGSSRVDFSECSYIASAGLGVLFATQKRLHEQGFELKLSGMNPHLREIFSLAGFDQIFQIEEADDS